MVYLSFGVAPASYSWQSLLSDEKMTKHLTLESFRRSRFEPLTVQNS